MIQYLHWYHEDIYGEKKLLKTSKNSNDPYLHTIRSLEDTDLGRDGFVQHIFCFLLHCRLTDRLTECGKCQLTLSLSLSPLRYVCIIANVMGKTECAAYLSVKDGAPAPAAAFGGPALVACAASAVLLWKWRTLQTTHITTVMMM